MLEMENVRDEALSGRIGKRIEYELFRNSRIDVSTVTNREKDSFSTRWNDQEFRKNVVPGKVVFSRVCKEIQDQFGVTLTGSRVVDELSPQDVPQKVLDILIALRDHFAD